MADGTKQKTGILCTIRRHVRMNGAFCLPATLLCFLHSASYAAEEMRPVYVPPPPTLNSGSIMQMIFSLLLVLASIILVAWLFRRMNAAQQGSNHLIKVLGGVSIGQRERIVLVEINNTWLVVGVGPGQIRTLHTLDKEEYQTGKTEASVTPPSENKFSSLLSSVLNHRRQDVENK